MTLSAVVRTSSVLGKLIFLLAAAMLIPPAHDCFSQTCAPVPSGLVGWWGGEGNANDVLGLNNGTLYGNTTFANGKVGQAFLFDGHGSSVTLNNNPNLQLQDFTIEAWIQRGSLSQPGGDELIFSYGHGGYGFGMSPDGTPFISNIDIDDVKPAHQITDTNFHHLAVTKSGTSVVFYVDGVAYPAPFYSTSYSFNTSPAIGARGDDPGGNGTSDFFGEIDEVSVYNYALAASDVQSIYNAGSVGKCSSVPPAIITEPTDQTVPAGASAIFSVQAAVTGPLTYQWQLGTGEIIGATNPVLILNNVEAINAGYYSVIVSNSVSSITSSSALLTVTPNVCTPPVSGLVGWWRAEGNATDAVSANNGTLHGNVSYTVGEVGQGFIFGGNGSYVGLNNTTALQLQNLTIEAWIQRGTLNPPGDQCIFGYGDQGYVFALHQNGSLFLSKVDYDNVVATCSITDTAFHHVAVTKFGTNVVFYLDGTAYPAPAYSTTYAFHTGVAIGSRGDNFSGNFIGEIDEVSVYNRALFNSEIENIYNAGGSGKCISASPPVIDNQPTDQTVLPGTVATFSVIGAGSFPLSYVWRFNGTDLSTATNSTLSIINAQSINAGNYSVIITNSYGSVTSSVATLTVQGPPVIVTQPTSQSVPQGAAAAFFVDAAGSGLLSYQWELNGTNPVGVNDYSLVINNAQAGNIGAYTVIVANAFGSVTSAPAILSVLLPPVITNQPQNQTNYISGNAYFRVGASSSASASLFYQWKYNGTNLAGATSSTLILNNLQPTAAGNYSAVVTNIYGKTTSSNAHLTVAAPICDPMPAGLVGWWQGEGSPADVVSGNLGTVMGNVAYVSGKVGRAFKFNGNNEAVLVGNSTNYQLQDFTIDAWIQRGSLTQPASDELVLTYGNAGYGMGLSSDGTPFLTRVDVDNVKPAYAITDTNWHHLAVTKSGTNVVFYVDGLAYPAPPYNTSYTFGTSLAIGARSDGFGGSFFGGIDEVDLFNRALSASEVQAIYGATSLGKCPVPLTIVNPPTNQSLNIGSNATLSVNAAGTGPIGYQWFLNGAVINGATNATLQLTHATYFQAGNYSVTISNSFGSTTVSNITVNVQPPALLVNGSFETGDFTGWVESDLSLPLYPLAVRAAGFNPEFGFFLTTPTDGNFCATDGFEGNGPGKISLAQDVILPSGPALLSFDYRMAWDMQDYGGSTLPRTFNVTIQPYGGGVPLHTFTVLTALPQTANPDTGPLSGSLDLSPYSGRGLRISFDANIPQSYTGPGFFQLDHVVLAYSALPPLVISKSGSNVILSWPASSTNYTLQATGNIRAINSWSAVNTNLIVHGPTNVTATVPLPSSPTFYRLKYP